MLGDAVPTTEIAGEDKKIADAQKEAKELAKGGGNSFVASVEKMMKLMVDRKLKRESGQKPEGTV